MKQVLIPDVPARLFLFIPRNSLWFFCFIYRVRNESLRKEFYVFFLSKICEYQIFLVFLSRRSEEWTMTLRRAIKFWFACEFWIFDVYGWKVWKAASPAVAFILLAPHGVSSRKYLQVRVDFILYVHRYSRTFRLRMSRRLNSMFVKGET
mgnify:FL=1